jgi:hypothetical protein
MKKLILTGFIFLFACSKGEYPEAYPCKDGYCQSIFGVDNQVNPESYLDNNGFWHVKFNGIKYFTVEGKLDELYEDYIINKIPLVEVAYDTDYWVWINNLTFKVPIYSLFGLFSDQNYNTPIPVGNLQYTIKDMAKNHPPLNIAGYQITPNTCMDCPYTPTLFNTYSKYTYNPRHMFLFLPEMKGDTVNVFIEARFGVGEVREVKENHHLKIILE